MTQHTFEEMLKISLIAEERPIQRHKLLEDDLSGYTDTGIKAPVSACHLFNFFAQKAIELFDAEKEKDSTENTKTNNQTLEDKCEALDFETQLLLGTLYYIIEEATGFSTNDYSEITLSNEWTIIIPKAEMLEVSQRQSVQLKSNRSGNTKQEDDTFDPLDFRNTEGYIAS